MSEPCPASTAPAATLHVALHVRDLARSIEFYRALLEADPDKVRPGYARFHLSDPPVVLSLNEADKVREGNLLSHLGVRVADASRLDAALRRMRAAGAWIKEQPDVECCYSRQSKFWVMDPDGVHWEFYVLTDDMQDAPTPVATTKSAGGCCDA